MTVEATGVEARIAALEGRLEELSLRLERVEAGKAAAAPARGRGPEPVAARAPAPPPAAVAGAADAWSGSSLLARVSTISFLLVVALGLRTIADSGAMSPGAGALAGLVYASSLMAAGWVLYARRSVLAPVFAICGALLLCSIVVETHSHFGSLESLTAHVILGAVALFMTALGERFRNPVPGAVGVLGVLFSALALNVPQAHFVLLLSLLLAASLLGAVVSRRLRGDWVGWTAFVISAGVLFVWAVRTRVSLDPCSTPGAPLQPPSAFLTLVWLYALSWLGQAAAGLLRPPREYPSVLSLSLPTLGPAVAYVSGLQVAAACGTERAHGVVGFLLAGVLVVLAAWTGHRRGFSQPAVTAFGMAAVVLFSLGFSSATGSLLGALPLLSLTALGFAVLAVRWGSGGTRVISYLLQIFVAVALALILFVGERTATSPALAALASTVLLASAFAHYRFCRRHAPPASSLAFSFLGQGDRCATALLTAALAGGFLLLRTGVAVALGGGTGEARGTFLGAQSLIINAAGVVLFALASRGRSRELRSVAILVTLLGAAKVFLYDLIAVQGIARVASVFSFGVLAAVASLVLGRWQRPSQP